MSNITDKVVVITGASSGIGESTAKLLAERGAKVVLAARRSNRIVTVVKEISATGGKAIGFATDVTKRAEVEALIQRAVDGFGRVDVLINNAGIMPIAPIEALKVDEWDRQIDVNIKGLLYGVAAALPHMQKQKSGHIINMASVFGIKMFAPGGTVYCATKAAVISLAKVAAVEYARDGIRVNCVCPGTFRSAIHDGLPPDALDAVAERHPLGLGTAADLVGAYSYLAGDAARWTTGSALVVDGGYSAP